MSTHALLPDWEPGYIRDLARATRLTYEPERLFGMLMAYLDDSQAPDEAPLYVIAGYVATATQWDQFEHIWSRFLALEGVECWSMRAFAQRRPRSTGTTSGGSAPSGTPSRSSMSVRSLRPTAPSRPTSTVPSSRHRSASNSGTSTHFVTSSA